MGASLLALAKSIYYNDTECYVRCDWRCPWSIRVQIHGDVTRSLFSLFCSTWRAVLKMFVRFRIKASEILEKSSTGAIYKTEKWRNGDKMSSRLLRNAWTTRNLHNSCRSCFIAMTYRLAVLQNVFAIILLWARKDHDVEKVFEETIYN